MEEFKDVVIVGSGGNITGGTSGVGNVGTPILQSRFTVSYTCYINVDVNL